MMDCIWIQFYPKSFYCMRLLLVYYDVDLLDFTLRGINSLKSFYEEEENIIRHILSYRLRVAVYCTFVCRE